MSDLGVIVTGVVIGSASGIGGAILGAWMNGRHQMAALKLSIAAENERATLAEKRHTFAACLAAANATLAPLRDFRMLQNTEEGKWDARTFREMHDAHLALINAVAELELAGAPEVAAVANQVLQAAKTYADQSLAGAVYEAQEMLDFDALISTTLRFAMLANLGVNAALAESAGPEAAFKQPRRADSESADPDPEPAPT